jgi:hypothetical protein
MKEIKQIIRLKLIDVTVFQRYEGERERMTKAKRKI